MIIHEHLNYYDVESLRHVVESSGLEPLEIRKGDYGGILFCVARASAAPSRWTAASGTVKFDDWVRRVQRLRAVIDGFIAEGIAGGHSLGCYVPLRVLPYLSLFGVTAGFRFFDDDSGIHHRYFDGFPVPVESASELQENPVTHLLILSFAFGEGIRRRINETIPGHKMKIACLTDFGQLKHT